MHWNDFLQSNGAQIKNNNVINFGQPEIESEATLNGNIITDLSQLAAIEVTGENAEEFLHGQFTSDINSLNQDNFQFSAWCNAKGQVLTNFFIFRYKTGFLLLVPTNLCEKFISRLKMYILRSDVIVNNKSNDLIWIGISLNGSNDLINNIIKEIPANEGALINTENYTCLRVFDSKSRFILIGETDAITKIWQQLTASMTPVGTHQWQLLDILAGLPWLNESCIEKFIPQYLNLDILNGVSFEKGCYPGQEVIARLQYRGEIKRRLFLASIQQEIVPLVGADLYLSENNRSIGKIINVQTHPELGFVLLAVAEIESVKEGNITLQKSAGNLLSFHSLPYSIVE
jgi:folate-binding protein YgfZ